MHLLDTITALGGIASARSLRAAGATQQELEAAAARGDLVRVRVGWYALPSCPPILQRAVRAGGRVGCSSALRLRGVWSLDDGTVHVRVGRGASVQRGPGLRMHWHPDHLRDDRVVDAPLDALSTAVTCLDLRHAIAVTDSALNQGLVSWPQLERAYCGIPRGRRVLELADPSAESGIETYARLGLRAMRVSVRSQVTIADVGRVDLLIGDRLVLEVDGKRWHDDPVSFERDRARDRRLAVLGYLPLRATFHQVLDDWPALRGQILTLVRRRAHLWRASDPGRSWSGQRDAHRFAV